MMKKVMAVGPRVLLGSKDFFALRIDRWPYNRGMFAIFPQKSGFVI